MDTTAYKSFLRWVSPATVSAVSTLWLLTGSLSAELSRYDKDAKPLLDKYCISCHGNDKQKADLNLEVFAGNVELYKERDLWEIVRDYVEEREMPPENKLQPSEEERIQLVQFINEELAKFDCDELE